jgi:hypothetical protein
LEFEFGKSPSSTKEDFLVALPSRSQKAVKSYIDRTEPEILDHIEVVVNTTSMEEAVQLQSKPDSGDDI